MIDEYYRRQAVRKIGWSELKMLHKLNKHNCFITYETIVICDDKKLKVKLFVAEKDGFWYIGQSFRFGSCNIGAYYGGSLPAVSKNRTTYKSCEEAIEAGLVDLTTWHRREVVEVVKAFVEKRKQLSLF